MSPTCAGTCGRTIDYCAGCNGGTPPCWVCAPEEFGMEPGGDE